MKIVIVNEFGKCKIKDTDFIPRIGDNVDMFYEPLPKVINVVLWPRMDLIKGLNEKINEYVDAIIYVK